MSTVNANYGLVTFERTVRPADFESKKFGISIPFDLSDAESLRQAKLNAQQEVLTELNIPYSIEDGTVIENTQQRGVQAVKAAFPGTTDVTPVASAPQQQSAPQGDNAEIQQAADFLRNYNGSNGFFLDVKGKTVDKGKMPSIGQAKKINQGER